MVAVPEQFKSEDRALGFLVEKELQILEPGEPRKPMIAVMGGAKVSDKILVIENLLPKIDRLLVGGAMTYTFLKAQGHRRARAASRPTGWRRRRFSLELAGPKLVLPVDHLVADGIEATAKTQVVKGSDIPTACSASTSAPRRPLLRRPEGCRHGHLERPDGQFEDEPFRAGTRGSPRRWRRRRR